MEMNTNTHTHTHTHIHTYTSNIFHALATKWFVSSLGQYSAHVQCIGWLFPGFICTSVQYTGLLYAPVIRSIEYERIKYKNEQKSENGESEMRNDGTLTSYPLTQNLFVISV